MTKMTKSQQTLTYKMKNRKLKWSHFKYGGRITYKYRGYYREDFDSNATWVEIEGSEQLVVGWMETIRKETVGLIINPLDDDKYLIVNRTEVKVI